jgi:hypothetical protein
MSQQFDFRVQDLPIARLFFSMQLIFKSIVFSSIKVSLFQAKLVQTLQQNLCKVLILLEENLY